MDDKRHLREVGSPRSPTSQAAEMDADVFGGSYRPNQWAGSQVKSGNRLVHFHSQGNVRLKDWKIMVARRAGSTYQIVSRKSLGPQEWISALLAGFELWYPARHALSISEISKTNWIRLLRQMFEF